MHDSSNSYRNIVVICMVVKHRRIAEGLTYYRVQQNSCLVVYQSSQYGNIALPRDSSRQQPGSVVQQYTSILWKSRIILVQQSCSLVAYFSKQLVQQSSSLLVNYRKLAVQQSSSLVSAPSRFRGTQLIQQYSSIVVQQYSSIVVQQYSLVEVQQSSTIAFPRDSISSSCARVQWSILIESTCWFKHSIVQYSIVQQ